MKTINIPRCAAKRFRKTTVQQYAVYSCRGTADPLSRAACFERSYGGQNISLAWRALRQRCTWLLWSYSHEDLYTSSEKLVRDKMYTGPHLLRVGFPWPCPMNASTNENSKNKNGIAKVPMSTRKKEKRRTFLLCCCYFPKASKNVLIMLLLLPKSPYKKQKKWGFVDEFKIRVFFKRTILSWF